jgi:antitoxin CptB
VHGPPDNPASDRYIKPTPGTVRAFGVGRPHGGIGMTGTARSSSGLDERRRRLLYRSWHRGTREMDLVMGRFADATIHDLNETEIAELEQLVDVPDPELFAWLTGDKSVPDDYDFAVFRRLRDFHALRKIG